MGHFPFRAAATACATFSLVMAVPSVAFASTGSGSVPGSTAAAGAAVVLVLGLAAMVALIVWRRRQPEDAESSTAEVTAVPDAQRLDDELAA
jgi:hypothetical protein